MQHTTKLGVLILLILSILAPTHILISYASQEIVNGKILNVERVFLGLDNPTNMAFIGPNDILVLEKNEGTVQRIVNGVMLSKPLLDVNVANDIERGMLGIAVGKKGYNIFNNTYVFLYYTESHEVDGGDPIGNRLYRYELANNKLIHPKLLLDLPYLPGPAHNGGVVTVGPDNNVYIVVGNLISRINVGYVENSLDQNVKDGLEPDGRGGILRVTQDGKVVNGNGILGEEGLLKFYYAYGIRNSFGIAFDPLSGKLWDTENGGYDEINLVEPGFNSGYSKVMGKASLTEDFSKDDLVEFNGKGKYSEPEFTWLTKDKFRVGPTALVFFNSDNFGEDYENDMFVSDVSGNIYHFDLNKKRTQLQLGGPLRDKVADNALEIEGSIFAKIPSLITDLEVAPDGNIYVLVYGNNTIGGIYRIGPSNQTNDITTWK